MLEKIICSLFLLSSLYCSNLSGLPEYRTAEGQIVSLQMCSEEDLKECEAIFIKAFSKAYENFTPQQLGVENIPLFLKEAFADVYDDFKSGQQKLVVAKLDGKIVGVSGFKPTEHPHQIYISQLAVEPNLWRHSIGRNLVFSALELYPDTQSLVVIPRRINTVAQNFYKKLGFHESAYMHPGYNPAKYVGYEWTKE